MSINHTIFLCGFMAAGKSAIGKSLATLIDVPFIDLDAYIEGKEGRRISQIFEEKSEAYFRKLEEKSLHDIITMDPTVVALGGGTLQNPALLELVKTRGVLVFIDTPMDMILERLKRNNKRPLLQNDDGSRMEDDALEEFVFRLYKKRLPIYQQATMVYKTFPGTADEQAVQLQMMIRNHAI